MFYLPKFSILFFVFFFISLIFNISATSTNPAVLYGTVFLFPFILANAIAGIWHIFNHQKPQQTSQTTSDNSKNITSRRILAWFLDGVFVLLFQLIILTIVAFSINLVAVTQPTTPKQETTNLSSDEAFQQIFSESKISTNSDGSVSIIPKQKPKTYTQNSQSITLPVSLFFTYLFTLFYFFISYYFKKTLGMKIVGLTFLPSTPSKILSRATAAAILANPLFANPVIFLGYYITDFVLILNSKGRKNILDRLSGMEVKNLLD